jgi:cell division protein FtsL
MGIFNKIYAVIAAIFVVVLGAFSIHIRAKKEGEKEAKAEAREQVQAQAQEARNVVKTTKEKLENTADEKIKDMAKKNWVRGAEK